MTTPELKPENRFKGFALFFKSYMSVMPIVTAAVAPILTLARAIPVFEYQRNELALYSGLLGFLLIGYVFFARDALVRGMFSRNLVTKTYVYLLPLILIGGSVYCYFQYQSLIDAAIASIETPEGIQNRRGTILATVGTLKNGMTLQFWYLGIFVLAEMAFVMMALREYALDIAKISEHDQLFPDRKQVR
jgi:hypothetical protein